MGAEAMIAFDFEYYAPLSIEESITIYHKAQKQKKKVMYYGGGTEFITFAKSNKMVADVVIDVKKIPECTVFELVEGELHIGAALTLTELAESNLFPLLAKTVKGIADHTSRNKITIGGNLNSQLIYREGILPFLLLDAKMLVASSEGKEVLPVQHIAEKGLPNDQLLVHLQVQQTDLQSPFKVIKRTRFSEVGYPVVTVAAIVKNKNIRFAISGVCSYPFRSTAMEDVLNDRDKAIEDRLVTVCKLLPEPIVHDLHASSAYREFVLKNILKDVIESLEGHIKND